MTYKPLFPVRSQVANIPVPFAVIQVKAEGCGALEKNMRKGVADRLSGQGIGWDRGISEAGFDESAVFPFSNHLYLRGEQESTQRQMTMSIHDASRNFCQAMTQGKVWQPGSCCSSVVRAESSS